MAEITDESRHDPDYAGVTRHSVSSNSSTDSSLNNVDRNLSTRKSRTEASGFAQSSALERQVTQRGDALGGRISRIQSITSRRAYDDTFTHPLAHTKTSADYLVDFEGEDDPYRPINWPFRKKCVTTALYGLTTMASTLMSTVRNVPGDMRPQHVYSPEVATIAGEYQVDQEVALLGISLTLAGFGLGPLVFGPFSELMGRKIAVLGPVLPAIAFTFACGASKDIQSILITRFFSGLFGSAPIVNTGGVLADIWAPTQRASAIVFYALAVVGGPLFGPIIGGAFVVSGVNWRWTQFLSGIFMAVIWVLDVLILDESYPPVLLAHKARRLRVMSGNWALHAKHEEWDPAVSELVRKFGVRPIKMLMTPICFLVALYASFCYGLLYGNLAAFPIIFEGERGWSPLVGSLPFLGLLVGVLIASCINILNQKFYVKAYIAAGNRTVPEARLPPMMIGSVFFAGGCFVLGWTSPPNLSAAGPLIGTGMLGVGFFTIFQAALNYLIDTFRVYSASAIAANTFLRSCFAIAFPLFVGPMYAKLGVGWATSVFGFFATALIPIPFLFYRYGPALRKRGKYSKEMDMGS